MRKRLLHGISLLPDCDPVKVPQYQWMKHSLELALTAENLGFDFVKITEHYQVQYGGYCTNPLIFLAAVASKTTCIGLMSGGIIASYHHPYKCASDISMLHECSGRRFHAGFAQGYLENELMAFSIDQHEIRQTFRKKVITIRDYLRTESTRDLAKEKTFLYPRGPLRTAPPISIATSHSIESVCWIAESGFGILLTPDPCEGLEAIADRISLYRKNFRSVAGGGPFVSLSLPILIRRDRNQAYEEMKTHLQQYVSIWRSALGSSQVGTLRLIQILEQLSPDRMLSCQSAFAGDESDFLTFSRQLREQVDIDHLLWQVDFGAQSIGQSLETIKAISAFKKEAIV